MVQVRKLVLAIAAASALSSGMAHALGLGELTLKSTLNQPLLAEIELLDVKELTAAEVVPSLASSEDFAKAGVDRQALLNDLSFTTVLNPGGKSIVRITSSQPLSEPMVKFLVQVMWPNGRLMRDYSVLLDPSKFSPQTTAAAQAAPSQVVTAPVTGATAPAEYTTTPRDTLWEIAAKARNGGSIQQTMLAIQALNPDAFIDGNINRLKTGRVLRLPDPIQSAGLPQPQAIAEVAAQNTAWREGRRYVAKPRAGQQQLDATSRPRGEAAPAQADRDSLSLVSGEAPKAGAKGAAGDAKNLSNTLAVAQESLDTTRRDNAELKSRMTDLQSQLDKLQRLIELKNNQLAKLQAEGASGAAEGDPVTPALSADLVADPATAPATIPGEEVSPMAATPGDVVPQVAPVPVDGAAPALAPDPAPVESKPATGDEQKFNELLTNPWLLGMVGGGAVILLLLLLLLARRRKAQQEAEKHVRMARALADEQALAAEHDLQEHSFDGIEVPPPSVKLANAPAPAPAPAPVPAPKPAPVIAPVVVIPPIAAPLISPAAERDDDVLKKAQSHFSAGRVNQAAALLEDGLKQEPQRSDLRLKLMEIYAQQGDRLAFVAQERRLVANGENFAQVEQLKSRFPAMAAAATGGIVAAALAARMDAHYVEDLMYDETPPSIAVAPVPEVTPALAEDDFDSDFDLSLDDLEAASPAVVSPLPMQDTAAELDAFPVGDELSFESVLAQQTDSQGNVDDLSDFDLDMDLGGDVAPEMLAEDDFLLSLDERGTVAATGDAPGVNELDDLELPADFDLSLADEMADPTNAASDYLEPLPRGPEPTFDESDALATADDEPGFDFLSGEDEVATKLDLAQAYIDMGDADGARDILNEVVSEGDDGQKSEAKDMLSRLA